MLPRLSHFFAMSTPKIISKNKIFILYLNEIYYHGAKNLTKWKSLDINFSNSDSVNDWTSKAMFSDILLSSVLNIKLKLFLKIKGYNYC